MTILEIKSELQKVRKLPPWGKKQDDAWDKMSDFIYQIPTFEALRKRVILDKTSVAFNRYTLRRWYNFWSARAVEMMFAQHSSVTTNQNPYDKLVDFTLQGIEFDHKTNVFPKGYIKGFEYARNHPSDLIKWLYENQSKEQRFHTSNRLFVVLYSLDENHDALRKELGFIQKKVDEYLKNFDSEKLIKVEVEEGKVALSDVIWIEKML
jgi:hypothetical protein